MEEKKERRRIMKGQAFRFVVSGSMVTLIDLGVLNALLFFLDSESQQFVAVNVYFVFRVVAFCVAVVCSYFLHKHFTFRSVDASTTRELSSFFIVAGLGFVANVGISTFIFASIQTIPDVSGVIKANIATILATGISLVVHFIGYKRIVFRK
jgi:putative flippase GtrA